MLLLVDCDNNISYTDKGIEDLPEAYKTNLHDGDLTAFKFERNEFFVWEDGKWNRVTENTHIDDLLDAENDDDDSDDDDDEDA